MIAKQYQEAALKEVQEEHPKYFEALNKSPRQLVGEKVPSTKPNAGPDDFEVLRDSADAKDWQETIQKTLVDEVKHRAGKAIDANAEAIKVTQGAIELFQNNNDLVPRTKEFDKELADKLIKIVGPYALRDEDKKLLGFSIPVQPIIDQLRSELVASRAATVPPTSDTPPAAAPPAPEDPPQKGIPGKAGVSGDGKDDIGDLFATLGEEFRNIRI